jgi:hypothetical protein
MGIFGCKVTAFRANRTNFCALFFLFIFSFALLRARDKAKASAAKKK